MATINRRSGLVSGGTQPFQPQVAFVWKGKQYLRNYGGGILQMASESRANIKAKETEFANRFRSLPAETRNLWDLYASSLGSAVDREKSDNVAHAKNIIPRRRKLMTGMNAYIGTNMWAFTVGMATPLDIAPLGEHTPPPPLHIVVTYVGGTANVSFTDPTLVGTPVARFVRLWAHLQATRKYHTQLVAFTTLPSMGPLSFTQLHTGHGWDSPVINLSAIPDGILRVQMDTLVARKPGQAPVAGPGSNVSEVTIVNP